MKKKISIISSAFNEEGNVAELYARVKEKMEKLNTLRESRRQRSQADRQGKKAETSKI